MRRWLLKKYMKLEAECIIAIHHERAKGEDEVRNWKQRRGITTILHLWLWSMCVHLNPLITLSLCIQKSIFYQNFVMLNTPWCYSVFYIYQFCLLSLHVNCIERA